MTLRARILDITPILLVFALVSAFATVVVVQYIVNEPLTAPAAQTAQTPGSAAQDR